MQVGDPTPITPAVNPAQALPVRPAVRQAVDGRPTDRDRRDGARDDGSSFRATLDAALPQGGSAQFATKQPLQTDISPETPRPEKRPVSADLEIDSRESARLLADSQNASRTGGPAYDGSSEMPTAIAQNFRGVTHQYAQSFFSVGGSLAARGDKLEVSA